MIGLDSTRNIIRDMNYLKNDLSEKEFLVVDTFKKVDEKHSQIDEYHFEPYDSNNIIYLGEKDLTYSITDLEKGLITRAPYRIGDGIQSWIALPIQITIPNLKRILRNKGINKTNAPMKIKERDDHTCQLCGETDRRTLNVHHIIPRKSPFFSKSFINSPMNQITLCANCHRIEHYVLENGSSTERRKHVKRMFEINGAHFWKLDRLHYAPMDEIKKYNQMEF